METSRIGVCGSILLHSSVARSNRSSWKLGENTLRDCETVLSCNCDTTLIFCRLLRIGRGGEDRGNEVVSLSFGGGSDDMIADALVKSGCSVL